MKQFQSEYHLNLFYEEKCFELVCRKFYRKIFNFKNKFRIINENSKMLLIIDDFCGKFIVTNHKYFL